MVDVTLYFNVFRGIKVFQWKDGDKQFVREGEKICHSFLFSLLSQTVSVNKRYVMHDCNKQQTCCLSNKICKIAYQLFIECIECLTKQASFVHWWLPSKSQVFAAAAARPRASYPEFSVILHEESHTIGLLSVQIDKYKKCSRALKSRLAIATKLSSSKALEIMDCSNSQH